MTRKILVVDDDADIRTIARVGLELTRGWHVVEAGDGRVGEDVARTERPDLILLDYMMPGQDGRTTLVHLRAATETARIPIVILTAKVQSNLEAELRAAGADGLIMKPFDPLTLADQVAEIVGWTG